jgi:hypothetical protein
LAVVQIQNRITPFRKTLISGRQINQDIAPIPKNLRSERAMTFDVSGKRVFRLQNETLR